MQLMPEATRCRDHDCAERFSCQRYLERKDVAAKSIKTHMIDDVCISRIKHITQKV